MRVASQRAAMLCLHCRGKVEVAGKLQLCQVQAAKSRLGFLCHYLQQQA